MCELTPDDTTDGDQAASGGYYRPADVGMGRQLNADAHADGGDAHHFQSYR